MMRSIGSGTGTPAPTSAGSPKASATPDIQVTCTARDSPPASPAERVSPVRTMNQAP
jgi:hypothetical protein